MKSFVELGVREDIVRAIEELGFEQPMPVQEAAIPCLLENDGFCKKTIGFMDWLARKFLMATPPVDKAGDMSGVLVREKTRFLDGSTGGSALCTPARGH